MIKKFIRACVWINVEKPRLMISIVAVISAVFLYGMSKLEFETSLNYLMPKDEYVYKLGQRASAAFLESETFIVSSVEAAPGKTLFSTEVFDALVHMVNEINEYRYFDYERETSRLDAIISLGNISVKPQKEADSSSKNKIEGENSEIDAEIDKLLEGGEIDSPKADNHSSDQTKPVDIWDMSVPFTHKKYDQPTRARNVYDYSSYNPVGMTQISESLDAGGRAQLETICIIKNLDCQSATVFSKSDFKELLEAWEDIYLFKSMEIIQIFINPVDGKDISGKNNQIRNFDFLEKDEKGNFKIPANEREFQEYKNRIQLSPLNRNLLYSSDENGNIRAFGVSVVLKSQENYSKFSQYLIPLLARFNQSPLEVHSMGSMVLEKYMADYMKNDLLKFMPLVLLVILFTFYFNFRTFTGILLPTLTVVLASVWTMGLMGLVGVKISLAVSILPPLLIAVGSSYGIHLLNQFMVDKLDLSLPDSNQLLIKSMMHIWVTVFLAAFTTIISFMTLSVNQVISLKHFGIFAAVGAFFAMVVGMILIPAGLSLIRPRIASSQKKKTNALISGFIAFLSRITLRHYRVIVIAYATLFLIGLGGIFQITTDTAPVDSFKEGSPIRLADEKLNKLFAGTINLTLIIDSGKENGVLDPEFLNWVENFRNWLSQPENKENYSILSNFAFSDLLKRMEMALNGDDPSKFVIPQNRKTIEQYMVLFSGEDKNSDGRADLLEQFVDKDFRRLNFIIRTGSYKDRTISSGNDRRIINLVNKYLENTDNPMGYKWFFVGTGINMLILSDYIVTGQLWSILISIMVMMLIIYLIFRKLRISFLAMVPLGGGICFVYGAMGYLGIPLDIPRAILSSIAIGVGIDDTIHFLKTYSHYRTAGNSLEDSIRKTYDEAGFAITYTALALILGFAVLTMSSFTPIFSLGLLVASVMLATTAGALMFLPAFILLLRVEVKNVDNSDNG